MDISRRTIFGEPKKPKADYSSVRFVRVHKEQFDAIEKRAKSVIIECKEDGRCIVFNRNRDFNN